MKKLSCIILLISLSFMINAQQTHVNREWFAYTGNPVFNPLLNPFGLEWTKSVVAANGDLITVSHSNVSGQGENIFLTRYDRFGTQIWQVDYNAGSTRNDYGIDVIENPSTNDIYVCGTTDNGGTTNYDIVTLTFNSSGVLQNDKIYDANGLNDIGTAIKIDSYGNIVVAASSESSTTSFDYFIMNYSTSLSLNWTNSYDYANLIEAPVQIVIRGGWIQIAGASANSLTDWDYAVANFDESTGAYISDSRVNVPGVGYDQPFAYIKDASGNTYLTGRASSNGINYDIRTVKINSSNSIVWTQTFDGNGLEDVGNTIAVDASGNVIVGGYSTKTNNKKDLICLKYNASGTLLWQHKQPSKDMTADAYIKTISLNNLDDIYFMAGEKGYTGNNEVLIGKINSSGLKIWERSIKGNYDYIPSDIQFGGFGAPGLYTIAVKDSTPNAYEMAFYTEHKTDTTKIYTPSGKPWYKANQILVRFQGSAIDTAAINNHVGTKQMEFGDLSDFLTTSAYTTVVNALSPYCGGYCDLKAVKIFDDPTTFTSTVSRLDEDISVPDFWASLLVELPTGMGVQNAATGLLSIPDVVAYSNPNYFLSLDTPLPNDTNYKYQNGIKTSTIYPNAGINVEEAWDVIASGGDQRVKVGVFDSGINWQHPDFGYDGGNPYSSKVSGWDLVANQPVLNNPVGDAMFNSHGTSCAGIIGAIRNNTIGPAGISGGDWTNNNSGVKLFSFNIFDSVYWGNDLFHAIKAMKRSAEKGTPNVDYQYGLNIMNNSWGIDTLYGYNNDTSVAFLNDVVHYVNRLKVTFVVSRGNDGSNTAHYPAITDDDWVLCVGSTASDGNYKDATIDDNYAADYGRGVDIAAPGATPQSGPPLTWTTNKYNTYNPFSGTSAAAPHVAGVVGLLMSYMNNINGLPDAKNLAPEDCEFIIQKTASPMPNGAPLPNDSVGYGRLNAGKALRMVEKPYRTLYHFATNTVTPYTIGKSVYSNSDTIRLVENYQNKAFPQVWFQAGKYVVKTFLITANLNHSLQFPTDSVMYCWTRPSSSEVLELFDGNKKLRPRERIQLNSYSGGSAFMQGYIYEVKDTLGNPLGWWPCDTTFSSPKIKDLFSYSILTKNTAVGVNEKRKDEEIVNIYPNPTNSSQSIKIKSNKESNLTVQLYDVMGRWLKTVYNGKTNLGENIIVNDVGNLPNSMYIYLIKIDDLHISKRFIKQ